MSKDLKRITLLSRKVHTWPAVALDFPRASLRPSVLAEEDDHVIPYLDELLGLLPEQVPGFERIAGRCLNALDPVIGVNAGQARHAGRPRPLDFGMKDLAGRPEVAASHCLVDPAHSLDVLLRHRLLRQPHGFEGFRRGSGTSSTRTALAVPDRPDDREDLLDRHARLAVAASTIRWSSTPTTRSPASISSYEVGLGVVSHASRHSSQRPKHGLVPAVEAPSRASFRNTRRHPSSMSGSHSSDNLGAWLSLTASRVPARSLAAPAPRSLATSPAEYPARSAVVHEATGVAEASPGDP